MKNRSRKSTIIIFCLLGVILFLTVAYAAFGTTLVIKGTTEVTSYWDVEIIDITSNPISGMPRDLYAPIFSATSATFKTALTSPMDKMQYDVVIKNNGNIDAKLDKIRMNSSDNPSIVFDIDGISEGDVLASGDSTVLKASVTYSNSVTSQPSNLNSSLTVVLDYVQK